MIRLLTLVLILTAMSNDSTAAETPPNYDESKIPPYTLPDPLTCQDGSRVATAKDWRERRRPEVLRLFATQVYGRTPPRPTGLHYEMVAQDPNALDGLATRKEVVISLTGKADGPHLNILLYIPNRPARPLPAFLGLNFKGNQTINADPGIRLPEAEYSGGPDGSIVTNKVSPTMRGESSQRWPVKLILERGYALVTAWYHDIEPDFPAGWKLGVRGALTSSAGDNPFRSDEWGAIGAWAWGLSRAMDYLEVEPAVDASRVALLGHSRLGKTALWAGAQDERFAIVISNNSGEGGAALARRNIGETTEAITRRFPHWFCGSFRQYAGREQDLPVDQHELIALVAPRPVYVASAEEDRWADPQGEFLSAHHAEPVYRLYGKQGLGVENMPPVHQPVGDTIGYHIRTGKHDVTDYDWQQYLDFADRHFDSAQSDRTKPTNPKTSE